MCSDPRSSRYVPYVVTDRPKKNLSLSLGTYLDKIDRQIWPAFSPLSPAPRTPLISNVKVTSNSSCNGEYDVSIGVNIGGDLTALERGN